MRSKPRKGNTRKFAKKYTEYVSTYGKDGIDLSNDIMIKDMLYGIGTSLSSKYKFNAGYRKFLARLRKLIDKELK